MPMDSCLEVSTRCALNRASDSLWGLDLTASWCVCRFQLVGIGCLRAAMADVPTTASEKAEEGRKALDPSKFAYISDRTYTAQEVEQMTAVVQRFTSADLRTAPNAKMFLRSYWYRSVQAGTMCGDEMHIYTLARFRSMPFCAWLPV